MKLVPRILPLAAFCVSSGFLAGCAPAVVRANTEAPPVLTVAVAKVTRTDLFKEIAVQAEFRPYQEVDLHAKVSGYLQKINVDIGDQVKAGDLIATIEVPELKNQLDQAVAAQQRAEADYKNAHLDYNRLVSVNQHQPNLVSQEEIDTAEAKDGIAAASLAAAKADVERYQTLFSYTRITAPFSGVVTKRYADPGALIQSGTSSSTQSLPLIRLSENSRLRLDFPVTESYAQGIRIGNPVEIKIGSSSETLYGVVARFTRSIAMETRTMETEVEVPNPGLQLIPGMYATVVLKTQNHPAALAVPLEAVSSGKNPTVYLISPEQKIEQRAVQLGLETATQCEVIAGLNEGDRVLIGDRSQVQVGEKIEPKLISSQAIP